jgi:hypothetical protein
MSKTLDAMQEYYDETNAEYRKLMVDRDKALMDGRYGDANVILTRLTGLSYTLTAIDECMKIVRANV